jgi:type I restriction enzyme M protein
MSGDDIATITKCFGNFEVVDARELDKPAEAKSNRGRQSAIQKQKPPKPSPPRFLKRMNLAIAVSP